jgi:hypothetical protein
VHDAAVIRNAILHLNNEQPLLADLYELPGNGDVGLRCTNLRMMNGKRPVFVDEIASVFFFPYLHIRFVEIPPSAAADTGLPMPVTVGVGVEAPSSNGTEADADGEIEIDEDFLRRIREV